MAATKYTCRVDSIANTLIDIKAALVAKSLITATLYETSPYLIFSTPLSSKVIKISIGSSGQDITMYYGDAYTSGSTITNEVRFVYIDGATAVVSTIVIADTTFFAICGLSSTGAKGIGYVGALDNGDVLVMGSSTASADCACTNLTDSTTLFFITFSGNYGFYDASGNLITMPLMLCQATGALEMNGAAPATVVGVKVSSVVGLTSPYEGADYYLLATASGAHGKVGSTSLLIPYTP